MVDVILGLQWGDEGKGKIADYLTPKYNVVARFQGGPNAGHSLDFEGKKFVLNTIPSGIFRKETINLIGNGVVIDPVRLREEIERIVNECPDYKDRLLISQKAHLILPTHRILDAASEAAKGDAKIGSTLRGIGPTYKDKIGRSGLRVGDILESDFPENIAPPFKSISTSFNSWDSQISTSPMKKPNSLAPLNSSKVTNSSTANTSSMIASTKDKKSSPKALKAVCSMLNLAPIHS